MQNGKVVDSEHDTQTLDERLDAIEDAISEIREGLVYATILVGLLFDED